MISFLESLGVPRVPGHLLYSFFGIHVDPGAPITSTTIPCLESLGTLVCLYYNMIVIICYYPFLESPGILVKHYLLGIPTVGIPRALFFPLLGILRDPEAWLV